MQPQQYQCVAAHIANQPKNTLFVIYSLSFLYFFIRFANLLQTGFDLAAEVKQ